jgi:hypothetical protein
LMHCVSNQIEFNQLSNLQTWKQKRLWAFKLMICIYGGASILLDSIQSM